MNFTPNKAIVALILAPVLYFTLALFITNHLLRDIFNSLSFGVAVATWVTWLYAFFDAIRHEGRAGKWRLILGICLTMQTIMITRVYSGLFNYLGRPESWSDGPLPGFFSFSYFLAGALILSAAAEDKEGPIITYLPFLIGMVIGGISAGIVVVSGLSLGF